MPIAPFIDRVALAVNTRTPQVPGDSRSHKRVTIGNATPGDLQIDFGNASKYAVIMAGGWHTYDFDGPTPQADINGGVSFYATAVMGGTMILEWTP